MHKIKHAEDFLSPFVHTPLLKLRTNVWIVKVTAKILDFNFLQWNCKETEAQFCEFVVMFLWLILVTEPSSLLRISRTNENTKVRMLQILHTEIRVLRFEHHISLPATPFIRTHSVSIVKV